MTAITALLARPNPTDDGWRIALRGAVDALDAIGGRSHATTGSDSADRPSRDRLITGPHERFPELWS
jgi:hypothetical protein